MPVGKGLYATAKTHDDVSSALEISEAPAGLKAIRVAIAIGCFLWVVCNGDDDLVLGGFLMEWLFSIRTSTLESTLQSGLF